MVQTKKQKGSSKNKKRTISKKSHKGGSSNADFMKAINKADLEYIQSNIKQMEDLSFEDASGKTPLDNAIEKYKSYQDENLIRYVAARLYQKISEVNQIMLQKDKELQSLDSNIQ